MKRYKKVIKIILIVIFIIGLFTIIKNYSVMISNNIKSKSYYNAVGVYMGDKTYSFTVDDESYKCKVNIYKIDKYNDVATIKYNHNNPKECVVVTSKGSYIIGWTIITILIGVSLIVIMKTDKK